MMKIKHYITSILCLICLMFNTTVIFAEETTDFEIIPQEKTIYLEKGEKHKITYGILPEEENKKVFFESEDEYIAGVDSSGYVLGRHIGKTKIKLSLSDRKTYAYVSIYVEEDEDFYKLFDDDEYYNQKPGLSKIYIMYNNESCDKIELMTTQTAKLDIKPYPSGTESAVKWRTSDDSVAEVDENGIVTAKKEGKCTVSAISKIGASKKDEIEVMVTRYIRKPDKISLAPQEETAFETGKTVKIIPTFYPEDTTEKKLRWLVFGSSAEINQKGELTILDKGTVKIRAVTYDWSVFCDLEIETKYCENHFTKIGEAYNVKNNRSIVFTFDSPVDVQSAYNNIFASVSDNGNEEYIDIEIFAAGNTVTVSPKTQWNKDCNYIYIKSGIKDTDGNELGRNYKYTIQVRGS